MSSTSRTKFVIQDLIDEDWFIDSAPHAPNPVKDFKNEMKYRRDNPFEARWVKFPDGKMWLFINAEPQDWTMY
jgi:hypothetical protein